MNTPLLHIIAAGGIYLEGNWTVTYDGRAVGSCTVCKSGLYYNFACSCNWISDRIYRLYLRIGGTVIDLGVLIPKGEGIALEKRLVIKQLPSGQPEFVVIPAGKVKAEDECFVPVYEDKAISCLGKLSTARFAVRNGVTGIIVEQGCT